MAFNAVWFCFMGESMKTFEIFIAVIVAGIIICAINFSNQQHDVIAANQTSSGIDAAKPMYVAEAVASERNIVGKILNILKLLFLLFLVLLKFFIPYILMMAGAMWVVDKYLGNKQ